jgi:hypothetical protein
MGPSSPCKRTETDGIYATPSRESTTATGQQDQRSIYETEGHRFESCRARSLSARKACKLGEYRLRTPEGAKRSGRPCRLLGDERPSRKPSRAHEALRVRRGVYRAGRGSGDEPRLALPICPEALSLDLVLLLFAQRRCGRGRLCSQRTTSSPQLRQLEEPSSYDQGTIEDSTRRHWSMAPSTTASRREPLRARRGR